MSYPENVFRVGAVQYKPPTRTYRNTISEIVEQLVQAAESGQGSGSEIDRLTRELNEQADENTTVIIRLGPSRVGFMYEIWPSTPRDRELRELLRKLIMRGYDPVAIEETAALITELF